MFRSVSSSQRSQPRLHIRLASRRRAAICIASAIAAALASPVGALANTEQDVKSGSTDLTAAATYTPAGAPTTTSDVTFVNSTYTPTTFTISGSNLSIGSLNDLDAQSQTITIQNGTNSTTSLLTLNGGDSVSGTTSDMLYVASGSTLSIVGTQGTAAVLNLALGASGNFDIAGTASISSVISGAFGLTKTGSGLLTLTGANTFSGGLTITAGTVKGSLVSSFGTGTININGGTLSTSAAVTFTQATVIGASGGTIDNQNAGKDLFATTGQLTGGGTLTRTGAAVAAGSVTNVSTVNDVQFAVADTGFTGAVILNGGITEVAGNALGTGGATNTITLNTGAEVVVNGAALANNLIINGGILSGDNGNQSVSGTVTANAPFSIRLADFYQAVNRNFTLSNGLSGSGAFTLIGSGATTAGAGQTLFLNGNNSGYTANINVPVGYNVSFGTSNSFGTGTVTINSNATALGGIGLGYDFGATLPTFTNTRTGTTTGGVFGINTTLASTTTLNMGTLNGGGMFLGSQSAGTYAAATLGPDGTTYRLGGGGGTLTFPAATLSGANNVIVGDTRINGNGTIAYSAAEPYTGTTTIASGSTLQLAGTAGAITGASAGSITDNGTFAINRTNAVVQGTDFPNNITGSGGVAMIGSGTLTLAGGNTYTGPTTIAGGTTVIAATNSIPSASVITMNGTGTLDLNGLTETAANLAFGSNTGSFTGKITDGSLTVTAASGLTLNSVAGGGATQHIDLSGLSQFTYNQAAQTFTIGDTALLTSVATTDVKLSATSNSITAATLTVGTAGNGSDTALPLTTLDLGASNTINANTINIGQYRDSATVAFQSGLPGTPSVVFRGATGGTSAIGLLQVSESQAGALLTIGTLDTTLGTVDAIVNSLVVGNYNPGGGAIGVTGTVKMTAGTMNLGTLTLGTATNSTNATPFSATFTQNAGSVLTSGITMGVMVSGDTTPTFTSTYNLGTATTSGTLLAKSIAIANTGTNTASRFVINFNNGTIQNYDGAGFSGTPTGYSAGSQNLLINGLTGGGAGGNNSTLQINLASTGTHAFYAESGHTITLASTALLAGTGGTLATTGPGTVIFQGSQTYTGATSVNLGTLQLAANGANLASAVSVSSGGTLAVTPGVASAVNSVTGLNLAGGANVTLSDGFINTLNVSGASTIAGASGLLTFDLGGGQTADSLTATGTNSITNTGPNERVALSVANGVSSLTPGDYAIITSGSATMTPSDFVLANSKITVGGNEYSLSLADSTPSTIFVTVAPFTGLDAAYWTGSQDNNWNTGGGGNPSNFATDATGSTNTNALPTNITDVYFTASSPQNYNPNNLGQSFTINSLNFTSGSPAVVIDSDSNSPTSTTNSLTLSSGQVALNDASANNQTINAPIILGEAQTWTNSGAGTLTAASVSAGADLLTVNGSGAINITSLTSSTGGLTAAGSATVSVGTATLSGAQLWTNNSSNALSVSTALNAGANLLSLTGTGPINIANFTGGGGINISQSTAVALSGTTTVSGAETFTNNSTNPLTVSGTISPGANALTIAGSGNTAFTAAFGGTGPLVMSGSGTLTLSGTNTSTGGITILAGTVQSGVDNALSTGALTFGVARTAGNGALNLGAFNQTFTSINVLSNSTTANNIAIGAGKTLTVSNGISIGTDNSGTTAVTTSKLAVSGAGSFSITGGAVYVAVGQATGNATNSDLGYLDLSNLTGPFTANVSAFAVGGGNGTAGIAGGGNDDGGVLTLGPGVNTITSPTITVGNSNQSNPPATYTDSFVLGTTTNILHVDNLYIGLSKATATMSFASQAAGSAGTVTIGKDVAAGGTTIDIGDQTGTGTAATVTGTLDLRGHNSTVTAGAVTLGNNNNTAGGWVNGVLYFDTGTFTATSVAIGLKSAAGTGSNVLNALNLSGGTFTVSGTTSLATNSATATTGGYVASSLNISAGTFTTGSLVAASKSNTGTTTSPNASATAAINVSGTGTLVVNSGGSFVLASQTGSGNAAGTLNITGGTVTSNVNITDGGGADTTTITLNGGLLDLTGHNFGGASATNYIDAFNFQAGTLQNVAEINNGTTALTKTTTGTLIVQGTNTYSGGTVVSAGTLRAESTSGSSTGTGAVAVNSGGILGGSGNIAGVNAIVSVNSGGKITAGTGATSSDTPALLTTTGGPADPTTITAASASQVWNDGGGYAWKLNNTSPNSAVSGGSTDPGGAGKNWDMLAMATLSVQSTNSVGFTITPVPLNGATLSSSGNPYTIADITSGYVAIGNNGPTNYSNNAPALAAALQGLVVLPANYTNAGYSVGAIPDGSGGDDLVIVYSPAPEPTSLTLMGLGAAGLMLRRRRRSRCA
jgi:fibronectin-binding autotransporter adhesin